MDEKIYDIWFSSLDISNKAKLSLLKKYNCKKIFNLKCEELLDFDIEEKDIIEILRNKSLDVFYKHLEIMDQQSIDLINVRDDKYPKKLLNIEDNPAFLHIRGNADILDEDSVGIVGCRLCTEKGRNIARNIACELGNKNINIVSGLAIGIDKFAHLGALDSLYGKTIAVLGAGVEDEGIYPFENKMVFERILKNGGAIISEYGIGSKPEKHHFPYRNRIISGLSDKLIVIEAKARSGSLITANYALEQGKDVFAVPGNIFDRNSVGTNNLIKEGAFLYSNINDIFML